MKHISLNTSYKHHSILGLIIGLWLVIFLVLIAPFDVADLSLKLRIELLPPYALLVFFGYMLGIVFQNMLFKIVKVWNIYLEGITIAVVYVIMALFCYPYYKSEWLNGEFDFWNFIKIIYIPIALIILVLVVFGRAYLNKLQAKKTNKKILLHGDNKTDVLHIDPDNIICISSAQNYVEIYYLVHGKVKKQLLRTTLKDIHKQVGLLIQVHRSHLINLSHFTKWNSTNAILLLDLEIPVSKKFNADLKEKLKFVP
nr:LytTR family DNA-binding domain-containing protein [uncultured Psychroserpens sp.]